MIKTRAAIAVCSCAAPRCQCFCAHVMPTILMHVNHRLVAISRAANAAFCTIAMPARRRGFFYRARLCASPFCTVNDVKSVEACFSFVNRTSPTRRFFIAATFSPLPAGTYFRASAALRRVYRRHAWAIAACHINRKQLRRCTSSDIF